MVALEKDEAGVVSHNGCQVYYMSDSIFVVIPFTKHVVLGYLFLYKKLTVWSFFAAMLPCV